MRKILPQSDFFNWSYPRLKLEQTKNWLSYMFRSRRTFFFELELYFLARINNFGFIILLLGWFDLCRYHGWMTIEMLSLVIFYVYLFSVFLKKDGWIFEIICYLFYITIILSYISSAFYYNNLILYLVIAFIYYPSKEICWWFLWLIVFFLQKTSLWFKISVLILCSFFFFIKIGSFLLPDIFLWKLFPV